MIEDYDYENIYSEYYNDAYRVVLKYPSGLIEKIEWSDETHTLTKSTLYVPVGTDNNADNFKLKVLRADESIIGMMYY